jgi:hydroxymethylpyrimidine/phosphomethylpyrimidine kinase
VHVVVTIAGSDSSAGAGIQADLKSIAACGAYGVSVLTAVTAQTPREVRQSFELPVTLVRAQLDAAFDAFPIGAVKSGMLASREIVDSVAQALRARPPAHFVLDPVMVSASGQPLLRRDAVESLQRDLVPLATLVTPNRHEARELTGIDVRGPEDAERAGRALLDLGCAAALVKGGHFESERATDVLVTGSDVEFFEAPALASHSTHGTGCTLSAAVATYLARGCDLIESIRLAKTYVTEAIREGPSWDGRAGPTDHFFYLRRGDAPRWLDTLRVQDASNRREPTP